MNQKEEQIKKVRREIKERHSDVFITEEEILKPEPPPKPKFPPNRIIKGRPPLPDFCKKGPFPSRRAKGGISSYHVGVNEYVPCPCGGQIIQDYMKELYTCTKCDKKIGFQELKYKLGF